MGDSPEDKMDRSDRVDQPRDFARRKAIATGTLGAAGLLGAVHLGSGTASARRGHERTKAKELSGRTAFITGGARGIGLAAAEVMANAGANIVIYDIASGGIPGVKHPVATQRDLATAKSKIDALGVKCLAFKGDVRDREALEGAMDDTVAKFGTLDVLVANAGVTQLGEIEEFSSSEVAAILDINIAGAVKTVQAAAPIMRKQRSGRMIFVSSILGRTGNELFPVYAASKWAVIGLAKSAALIFAPHNVMCNAVCPGLVQTKLIDNDYALTKMVPHNPTYEGLVDLLRPGNPIPMGSYQPADIAKAIVFFAGDATAQVTGEVFDISSGATARNIG